MRKAGTFGGLGQEVAGLFFPLPLGLAAGYDKDARAVSGLFGLGLGFVEVGTVTPEPQKGNPKPRIFLLKEDDAIINRLGFNNRGAERTAARLARLRKRGALAGPLGVNIGPGRGQMDDPETALRHLGARLAPLADYLTVNLSSPNTPGLRDLQSAQHASGILRAVRAGARDGTEREIPILLKISSDISEKDLRAAVGLGSEGLCQGLIIGNTTTSRPAGLRSRYKNQEGGLSGRPLFSPSTERLAMAWRMSAGRVPLVGVGGVDSPEAAWLKITHGASLVQLYTGLVYQGPGLVRRILKGLAQRTQESGYRNISQAVGSALKTALE